VLPPSFSLPRVRLPCGSRSSSLSSDPPWIEPSPSSSLTEPRPAPRHPVPGSHIGDAQVPLKGAPPLSSRPFAPSATPKPPPDLQTLRRRQLRSPRSLPLRRRGVVQELRSVVRKPLAPRLCRRAFVARTSSPEQVLAAAHLYWTACCRHRANRCETPWLCSRRPQLAPGLDRVENCGRTFHPGQLRPGAATHR
jgi:hypothetical protein